MKLNWKETNLSGSLSIEEDAVKYALPGGEGWLQSIGDIKIVGEYTNSYGPHLDDYLLVFVLADGSWFQASFYADGRDVFLAALSARVGHKLECGLCNCTTLKSRVLWPRALTGQNLFTFVRAPESKNVVKRLFQKLSPTYLFELSEPVRKTLGP